MSLSLGLLSLDFTLRLDLLYLFGNVRVIDVGDEYGSDVSRIVLSLTRAGLCLATSMYALASNFSKSSA